MEKLSASQLKTFIKCGYSYYLTRITKVEEPGKKSYGLIHGRILDKTLEHLSVALHRDKEVSYDTMVKTYLDCFLEAFTSAGIPTDLHPLVSELMLVGAGEPLLQEINVVSDSINASNYKFKTPKLLKGGKLSSSKTQPHFGAIQMNVITQLEWFLQHSSISKSIKAAEKLEHQVPFSFIIDDMVEVVGYMDQVRTMPDGTEQVSEFKTDKTEYTERFVNSMIQVATYQLAKPSASVDLVDLTHRKELVASYTSEFLGMTRIRYKQMAMAKKMNLYAPVCGTDPFRDKQILCGFKGTAACMCSGPSEIVEEESVEGLYDFV